MNDASYISLRRLNITDDIEEARLMVHMTVKQLIELCGISRRTWYRWKAEGSPKWAVRLVLSQTGDLTHLGWKSWEIRGGLLYCNELAARYHWEPFHLVLPLYGIDPGKHLRRNRTSDKVSMPTPIHLPESTLKRA